MALTRILNKFIDFIDHPLIKKIKETKQIDNKLIYKRKKFKKHAKTITVDLDKIKIFSNKWNEEMIIDKSKYAGLNQLAGHSDKNIKNIDRVINTILFEIPIHGKVKIIRYNIEMNTDNLKIVLALKKETNYYYDMNQPEMNFLDLDFLHEQNRNY